MKSLLCMLFLGIVVTTSFADVAALEDSIADTKAAIRTRLAEIGDPPAKADQKEAKLLGKALSALDAFEDADKKGVKLVGKATKLIEKASPPADLMQALEDLVGELETLAEEAKQNAEDGRGDLSDQKNVAKVQKLIDKYVKILNSALEDFDMSALSKLFGKAIAGFEKAVGTADKLLAKEIKKGGGGGGGLSVDGSGVISGTGGFTIQDILYDLKIKFMGNTRKVKGKLSDTPDWSPIPVPGGTPFDGATFLPIPDSIPGFDVFFSGTITYVTDKGNLKFTFR